MPTAVSLLRRVIWLSSPDELAGKSHFREVYLLLKISRSTD